MPRQAREKSDSGTYHVILRGINQQKIFEDEEDYQKLFETLVKYKTICEYEIFAYCFMDNHIHLLIKTGKETLGQIFKRIGGSYVYWYNNKYKRSGHLFQDRYKSEVVEDDGYFLSVIRYIHLNPQKAGLCKTLEQYKFSSYGEYLSPSAGQLINSDEALTLLNRESFISFHKEESSDNCLELKEKYRLSDKDALRIIKKISKCSNSADFQALPPDKRDKYIKSFKKEGLSIRQISRLTGISFGIIRKI